MKIFGFYITRTDWESLFDYERQCRDVERQWALDVNSRLVKLQSKQPIRDSKGRFISKKDLMTAQLKAEQRPHWDDIRK